MPLPPKGDPRRPLHTAVRSMRLIGGVFMLFATCSTVVFVGRTAGGRGAGGWPAMMLVFLLPMTVFYILPAACFIILSIYLARRQFWAVVASICLASLSCLIALLGLIGLIGALIGESDAMLFIPLGITLLVVFALAQLIYHLAKSFEAIRHVRPEERGFEPIMVPPAPAAEMSEQGGERHDQPPSAAG